MLESPAEFLYLELFKRPNAIYKLDLRSNDKELNNIQYRPLLGVRYTYKQYIFMFPVNCFTFYETDTLISHAYLTIYI